MVYIIATEISPRLKYVADQIFAHFLNVPYKLLTHEQLLKPEASDFVIQYSEKKVIPFTADLTIVPVGLLERKDVEPIEPKHVFKHNKHHLFVNDSEHFGFDVFSAVFWLLTRYEEYGVFTPDAHGRFQGKESFAFKKGFLEIPVVDYWVEELAQLIRVKNHDAIRSNKHSIIITIDVDNAYAFKGKKFLRQCGAMLKHFFKGEWKVLKERWAVLRNKKTDPYDTYEYIKTQAVGTGHPVVFFHLLGDLDRHDRNISAESDVYSKLLKELSEWSAQGIHPSYASNLETGKIELEIKRLKQQIAKEVDKSRQHFLKLEFPNTYMNLLQNGIKEDYTMGFADVAGFRAGTSKPFYFYNVKEEKQYNLNLFPFCVMDGTLKDYMKCSPQEAISKIKTLQQKIKEVNGLYIAIWHNETLGEVNGWHGWRAVFESQYK